MKSAKISKDRFTLSVSKDPFSFGSENWTF